MSAGSFTTSSFLTCFFFSSRRRHTRWPRDWSSDVCSSDLVGKSSLVNAILNEERVIVSSIEGTTRDAVDTYFQKDDQEFTIIDTAGIRKKGKVYESTEKYSVLRALKAIDRSDVVLTLIDAETGIREQDKTIAGYAQIGRAH